LPAMGQGPFSFVRKMHSKTGARETVGDQPKIFFREGLRAAALAWFPGRLALLRNWGGKIWRRNIGALRVAPRPGACFAFAGLWGTLAETRPTAGILAQLSRSLTGPANSLLPADPRAACRFNPAAARLALWLGETEGQTPGPNCGGCCKGLPGGMGCRVIRSDRRSEKRAGRRTGATRTGRRRPASRRSVWPVL